MTYRAEFAFGAALTFHELPPGARDALIERTVQLASAPWDDTRVAPPGEDVAFRQTAFGGAGILYFQVVEREEVLRLYRIVWAG